MEKNAETPRENMVEYIEWEHKQWSRKLDNFRSCLEKDSIAYIVETYGEEVMLAGLIVDELDRLVNWMGHADGRLDSEIIELLQREIERKTKNLLEHTPWRHNCTSIMVNVSNMCKATADSKLIMIFKSLIKQLTEEK